MLSMSFGSFQQVSEPSRQTLPVKQIIFSSGKILKKFLGIFGLTGVAGCRFDDGVPLLQETLLFRILHHAEPDAILDAPARVEKLAFRNCRAGGGFIEKR